MFSEVSRWRHISCPIRANSKSGLWYDIYGQDHFHSLHQSMFIINCCVFTLILFIRHLLTIVCKATQWHPVIAPFQDLHQALCVRDAAFAQFTKSMTQRVGTNFIVFLTKKGYAGRLKWNHVSEECILIVSILLCAFYIYSCTSFVFCIFFYSRAYKKSWNSAKPNILCFVK